MNPGSKAPTLPGWLLLIAAMTAVGPISIDMYLPGFPLIESDLGVRGVERTMASYLLGLAFGMAAMFSYVIGAHGVMMHQYQLSPQQFGWLIGINGIAFMSASRLNIISLRRVGPGIALQFCFFISVERVGPNVSALALAEHAREAGAASALMGSVQSVLSMLAGIIVAAVTDGTVRTIAILMTAGAACCWLSYAWATRQRA